MPGAVSPLVIIGVGNLLRSDEGVGVHAVRALQQAGLGDKAPLVDGGTAVFEALGGWAEIEKLIVIDALQAHLAPGEIVRLTPEEVAEWAEPVLSLHQQGLLDSLCLLRQAGLRLGEVVIFGVQPAQTGWGTELSEAVAGRLPRLVEIIQEESGLSAAEEKSK